MRRWTGHVLGAAFGLLVCGLLWWSWPAIAFHQELAMLVVDHPGPPTHRGVFPVRFSVNTYTDEVSSETIAVLYHNACRWLDAIRGSHPRRIFHWIDIEGWDRVTSVVETPWGCVEATASNNNDNDGVSVQVYAGPFNTRGRRELSELVHDDFLPLRR